MFRISEIFGAKITDYDCTDIILECMNTENKNNELIRFLKKQFANRVEIARGGSVAMEAIKR